MIIVGSRLVEPTKFFQLFSFNKAANLALFRINQIVSFYSLFLQAKSQVPLD